MNVIDYVARKFDEDGTGEFIATATPIEGLLWELLVEAKRLRAENARLLKAANVVDTPPCPTCDGTGKWPSGRCIRCNGSGILLLIHGSCDPVELREDYPAAAPAASKSE